MTQVTPTHQERDSDKQEKTYQLKFAPGQEDDGMTPEAYMEQQVVYDKRYPPCSLQELISSAAEYEDECDLAELWD